MKKAVKILIVLILIVIAVFVGNIVRKFLVFDKISKISQNLDYSNFYNKEYIEEQEDDFYLTKVCDDVLIRKESQGTLVWYKDEAYILIENNGQKTYIKADNAEKTDFELKYFEDIGLNKNETFNDKIELSLKTSVKSEDFAGKECYAIKYKDSTMYIDKETLYVVGIKDGEVIKHYEIEFGTQKLEDYTLEKILDGYTEFTY